jgi:hypothetical protein
MPDSEAQFGLSRQNMLGGPIRKIVIRDEGKSESALCQSLCDATAQRAEYSDLVSPVAAGQCGSNRKFRSVALSALFCEVKSTFYVKSDYPVGNLQYESLYSALVGGSVVEKTMFSPQQCKGDSISNSLRQCNVLETPALDDPPSHVAVFSACHRHLRERWQ